MLPPQHHYNDPMDPQHHNRACTCSVLVLNDGRIVVVSPTNSAEGAIFDSRMYVLTADRATWSTLEPSLEVLALMEGHGQLACTMLPSGEVALTGSNWVVLWNPASDVWKVLPKMTRHRGWQNCGQKLCGLQSGKIVVVGGAVPRDDATDGMVHWLGFDSEKLQGVLPFWSDGEVCPARVRSQCRFVLPIIRFIPYSLTYSVPLSQATRRPNPRCSTQPPRPGPCCRYMYVSLVIIHTQYTGWRQNDF
jgi:hypothetical protein